MRLQFSFLAVRSVSNRAIFESPANLKGRVDRPFDGGISCRFFTAMQSRETIGYTSSSGRVAHFSRDAANRVTLISTTVTGISVSVLNTAQYNIARLPIELVYGNSVVDSRQYDQQGRMTSWNIGNQNSRTHEYDSGGNLLSINSDSFSSRYGYDSLDRLTGDTFLAGTSSDAFTYDGSGNRLSSFDGSSVTEYEYVENSNKLIAIGAAALTLDQSGNLLEVEDGGSFSYNQANRLKSSFNPDTGITTHYLYNALGLRVKKTVGSTVVVYTYDLDGNLVSETDEVGATIREYIWLDGALIAQIDVFSGVERLTFVHTDHLLTPRLATDQAGASTWRWQGDAFGILAPEEDLQNSGAATVINLRFPGQYFGIETGFH